MSRSVATVLSFAGLYLTIIALTLSGPAMAYIGPGAGITMLGALWGVLVAIVLAIGSVLFWPIRALMRRRRSRQHPGVSAADAQTRDQDVTSSPGLSQAAARDEAH